MGAFGTHVEGACRAAEGLPYRQLLEQAVKSVLERTEPIIQLPPTKNKAQQQEIYEAWELHWGALLVSRSGLLGKSLSKLALRSSVGIISPHPTGARHALALLTYAMKQVRCLHLCMAWSLTWAHEHALNGVSDVVQNAAAVFKEDKDLAGWMAGAVAAYEAGGVGGPSKKADKRRSLRDRWVRLELARMCAAAVYADWTSTQGFVRGIGEPFWRMLCLLATQYVP